MNNQVLEVLSLIENKKSDIITCIDELKSFEIISIETLQKAHDRRKYYKTLKYFGVLNYLMYQKFFDFWHKKCDKCNIEHSFNKRYQMIHAVLSLLKKENKKMTFKELSEICECQIIDIKNFLDSQYNCGKFENNIIDGK